MGDELQAAFFDPGVPGLYRLLFQNEEQGTANTEQGTANTPQDAATLGFRFYPNSPLRIVLYGAPGSGKSLLALQMAATAASADWQVIYFTKDTPGFVLKQRVIDEFGTFGLKDKLEKDRIYILEELCEELSGKGVDDGNSAKKSQLENPFLGFARFSEAPLALRVDRYATAVDPIDALARFCPQLRALFDRLPDSSGQTSKRLVVCDSLSPKALESHLRLQTQLPPPVSSSEGGKDHQLIYLFIMESHELPVGLEVAYPPDVEIRMGDRPDSHGVHTRTLRLLKTRFQPSLDEESPVLIIGAQEAKEARKLWTYKNTSWENNKDTNEPYHEMKPGVHILRPLMSAF